MYGSVSGLHCTWLVPRTRGSSDDADRIFTMRVDPLEEGRSTWKVVEEVKKKRVSPPPPVSAYDSASSLMSQHMDKTVSRYTSYTVVVPPEELSDLSSRSSSWHSFLV
ncbi:hypothetical protein M9H77_17824 [Catharanthus roseus]|uniref:Uncharacterized protein n=1 Tax=Catharanthus roseus TaxID=4058 RepID=A0ACC0B5Q6_CATRO|nr:hypothetical protein M9H77_17824 [Catharanthus roseus]